jgi:hypothetical protein
MADTFNKRFDVSDVFTSPYEANKSFYISSASFENNNIILKKGTKANISSSVDLFNSENLFYQSLLTNYYPEFYSISSHSTSSYFQTNNLNNTLLSNIDYNALVKLGNGATTEKYYPISTGSYIYALNIPKSIYYNKIQPGSFKLNISGGIIYDDGEYNLRWYGLGTRLEESGSTFIRLNVTSSLPLQLNTLTVNGNIRGVVTRNSSTTFTVNSPVFADSSSYLLSYYVNNSISGSDLTAYSTTSTNISADNTLNLSISGNSNYLTCSFAGFNIIPPTNTLSDFNFPGGTLITITGTQYFTNILSGSATSNTAQLQSIDIPNQRIYLTPPWQVGSAGIPPGTPFSLTRASSSYVPSNVVTASVSTFPIGIDNIGSINIGGTTYGIVNRLDIQHLTIDSYITKPTNTNFTASYSSSALFTSGTISAGGYITVPNTSISSSIGTVLSQSSYIGNIFYEQGLATFNTIPTLFTTSSLQSIELKNTYPVYEQTIKCVIKDYEFNASYNPTLTTGSVGFLYQSASNWNTGSSLPSTYSGSYYTLPDNKLKDFATGSDFSPYVSTIGLYNDSNQLLAIAKMAQPVPLSNNTDQTFIIKMDW